MSRSYGHLERQKSAAVSLWIVKGEPHVLMMFKRVFPAISRQYGTLKIGETSANNELLEWLLVRYPLEMSAEDAEYLRASTDATMASRIEGNAVIQNGSGSFKVATRIPLRDYQLQAVRLLALRSSLLCGDDLGLGKTAVALGAIASGMTPAIIVCKTHLQRQWFAEALKFLSGVIPHIAKKASQYPLPIHNLLIITYSKLSGWAEHLNGYKFIAFDEAQELRIEGTSKYAAAKALCEKIPNRLELTATPIYNYGDEIFNLLDLINPGVLGQRFEFLNEWCIFDGRRHKVTDPNALGSFLRESHAFLRRRRQEVGRELPPVTRISEEVEHDSKALLENEDKALELAQTILRGKWEESGQAALMLDAMMRLQTGLAKAPHVADFVSNLVESGESVVLVGWHREVYAVWQRAFIHRKIECRLYTGSESPTQKQDAAQAFMDGTVKVLILSLRSGEGLNGLQNRASVMVFGELDWSPQVHEQCIGRLNRDGQTQPVTAIYLYAAGGSDPAIATTLGVKRSQSEGIINPGESKDTFFGGQETEGRAAMLARQILARKKGAAPTSEAT